MAHTHIGCQSPRDYFTEQLLSILVCGAVAFVAVQMYRDDMLKHILAPQFHLPVMLGGIGVFLLVAVRAIAVWCEAGELQPVNDLTCQENHVHTNDCCHLTGLPDGNTPDANLVDDHGHSHDMSWVFARMLVLVFPVLLFFMGIPNSGLSAKGQLEMAGNDNSLNLDPAALEKMADASPITSEKTETDGTLVRTRKAENGLMLRDVLKAGKRTVSVIAQAGEEMRFNTLTEAAFDPSKRESYAGKTAILEGRFRRLTDKEFTLFRMKMTCCGPDAVPLKVRIIAPQSVTDRSDFDWVRVKGVIQFRQVPGQDRFIPVLMLQDITDIQFIPNNQIKNEYEF